MKSLVRLRDLGFAPKAILDVGAFVGKALPEARVSRETDGVPEGRALAIGAFLPPVTTRSAVRFRRAAPDHKA